MSTGNPDNRLLVAGEIPRVYGDNDKEDSTHGGTKGHIGQGGIAHPQLLTCPQGGIFGLYTNVCDSRVLSVESRNLLYKLKLLKYMGKST